MQRHLISTLKAEVDFNKRSHYLGLQNEVAQALQLEILPRLNRLMDELCNEKTVIRIDRLELDLGSLNIDNWEEEFTTKFLKLFEQQIKLSLTEQRAEIVVEKVFNKTNPLFTTDQNDLQRNIKQELLIAEQTKEESNTKAMLFYLERGILPWYIQADFSTFLNDFVQVFSQLSIDTVQEFLNSVYKNGAAKSRWKQVLNKPLAAYLLKITAWEGVLKQVAGNDKTLLEITTLFLEHTRLGADEIQILKAGELIEKVKQFFATEPEKYSYLKKIIEDITHSQIIAEKAKDSPKATRNSDKTIADADSETLNTQASSKGEQHYFIDNAGLIILYPFLAHLFEHCGYTQNNEFVNDAAISKAILLSQYLITGQIAADETELLLNKILCGLAVDFVVDFTVDISEEEKKQGLELLQAAIGYWDKLGKTSIEGLQNSFLKRKGKLIIKEESLHLLVERQGIDILIGTLPWTLSIVKTPFMEIPIMTEW